MKSYSIPLVIRAMQIKSATRYHFTPTAVLSSVIKACPTLGPHGLEPTRLLCPWNFPSKNTGVGCHFLLQGIFPTVRALQTIYIGTRIEQDHHLHFCRCYAFINVTYNFFSMLSYGPIYLPSLNFFVLNHIILIHVLLLLQLLHLVFRLLF